MLSTTHAQGRPHQAMCVRSAAKGRLDSSRLSQATRERTVRTPSAAVARENSLYVEACRYATGKRYEEARRAFESLLERHPHMCNAWVSYAQMEKRRLRENNEKAFREVSQIFQRGMLINPYSSCLAQAWGLLELQKGNDQGAVMLLERSVRLDPKLSPVLNWRHVRSAKTKVSSAWRKRCTS